MKIKPKPCQIIVLNIHKWEFSPYTLQAYLQWLLFSVVSLYSDKTHPQLAIILSTDIRKTKELLLFVWYVLWCSCFYPLPLSGLPAESLCVTLKLTLTALNMLGQPCQTDLWIPNSLESCSIFHWSWIFKKINPLKTYHSGALCPKNKIASAISHYRQPHQPPSLNCSTRSVLLSRWQNPSGNQLVSIN